MNTYSHNGILKPDVVDSKGFGWTVETINKFAAGELTLPNSTHLTRRAKQMSTDY